MCYFHSQHVGQQVAAQVLAGTSVASVCAPCLCVLFQSASHIAAATVLTTGSCRYRLCLAMPGHVAVGPPLRHGSVQPPSTVQMQQLVACLACLLVSLDLPHVALVCVLVTAVVQLSARWLTIKRSTIPCDRFFKV